MFLLGANRTKRLLNENISQSEFLPSEHLWSDFFPKPTRFKKAQCICRIIHGGALRGWASCGPRLNCWHIKEAAPSFFCPTSPYPACVPWRRPGRGCKRSRSAAPDKSQFWWQGKVNRKVSKVTVFRYPVPCTAEGTWGFLSEVSNANYTSRLHHSHCLSWDRRERTAVPQDDCLLPSRFSWSLEKGLHF